MFWLGLIIRLTLKLTALAQLLFLATKYIF
jgi:hypothetical protein